MPPCERTLESAVEARTFTGPDETQVVCQIGARLDIKHFVWMQSLRSYPIYITSSSRIISDPRLIRFELSD